MGGFAAGPQIPGVGMTVAPNAGNTQRLSTWFGPTPTAVVSGTVPGIPEGSSTAAAAQGGGPGGGGGRGGQGAAAVVLADAPRVIMRFPQDPKEMLLSGVLVGGESLAGRAQVVDAPIGKGHVVMFAIRPFWRAQTQGTYFLGFNAILNWNDLDAGKK